MIADHMFLLVCAKIADVIQKDDDGHLRINSLFLVTAELNSLLYC